MCRQLIYCDRKITVGNIFMFYRGMVPLDAISSFRNKQSYECSVSEDKLGSICCLFSVQFSFAKRLIREITLFMTD
jgi:hypothetical protein